MIIKNLDRVAVFKVGIEARRNEKKGALDQNKNASISPVCHLPMPATGMDMLIPPLKKQKCKQNACSCPKQPKEDDSKQESAVDNGHHDVTAHRNCYQGFNTETTRPKKLEWFVAEKSTVLHINVQITQAASTNMSSMQAAEQVLDVYSCFRQYATIHGISIVELRTNSFVCVLDADDPDCAGEPVGQLLAFATDLNHHLLSRPAPLHARMGMASGPTALIGTPPVVVGDAANIAEDMARLGAVAAVAVHESALWRWAAAAGRAPPPASRVDCASGRSRGAAVFDLETGSFAAPTNAAAAAAALETAAAAAAAPKIIAAAAAAHRPPPGCAGRRLSRSASFA